MLAEINLIKKGVAMSENNDQNRSQEWLDALAASLKKNELSGKTDIVIDYRTVSQSFPGDPHPDSFDYPLINWDSLKLWANEKGWDVKPSPEKTQPDEKSTPRIRFTKISHAG